jgi:hypothetical protein
MRAKVLSLILGVLVAAYETHGSIAIADTQTSAPQIDADIQASISAQIEPDWNLSPLIGKPEAQKLVVLVSVKLAPDGTIDPTSMVVSVNDPANPYAREAMNSCRRPILITKQLKLPPGKDLDRITIRFPFDIH